MKISLIAAISNNRVLGNQGKIPWESKADMLHFKSTTSGKPVIMGYNTWVSLGRKAGLPNRLNVVVTNSHFAELQNKISQDEVLDKVIVVKDLTEAISVCENFKDIWGEEIWIIGGAQIYKEAITSGIVDEIVLTRFSDLDVEGDTFLMEFETLTNAKGELLYELEGEVEIVKGVEPPMRIERYKRVTDSPYI